MVKALRLLILYLALAGRPAGAEVPNDVTALNYTIVQRHAHDSDAFTQGLLFYGDRLYESTGLYGQSSLRYSVPGETTAIAVDLPDTIFAEGITILNQRLYLLTWKDRQLLSYDPNTLTLHSNQRYHAEGWGMTTDGTHLITSDGSDRISFRDPATLTVMASIDVRENGKPLKMINELEWIHDAAGGAIWANVWPRSRIVRIDPQTGNVTHSLDLSALLRDEPNSADPQNTLNGIAWQISSQTLWVTGKRWQYLYQLRINGL